MSGHCDICAALTADGRVYITGKNNYGQFGNGTTADDYSSSTEVRLNEVIKDVRCSKHTLFLTKSNMIIGCGNNYSSQLFQKTEGKIIKRIICITSMEADRVITCQVHSFILSEAVKIYKQTIKGDKQDDSLLISKIAEQANIRAEAENRYS